ncbi:MAG: LysR substrate-binding domain-containing protein [Gammaproteobacteria bacterium]
MPAMQDLNAMYLFAKVVEHGSYSAAARALGLQTSKLSRRVSELERQLGVRLLQRTTRRVTVTEIGQTYYQHCAALEAEALAAQEAIDRTRSAPQGTVRVSCPISLMNGGVGPLIAKFLVANPLVRVYVDMTNRRVDVVEEGFDLAIRVRRPPLEPTNLAMRKLGESEGVVVGHPALLARLGRPAHPNDVARFPTLSMTTAGDRYAWEFREKDGTPISVNHVPRLMTDSFDALRAAAVAGVGLALLPHFVVYPDIQRGELERVLPEFGLGTGIAHVVFPTRRGMVPAVRALIDALVEGFKEVAPNSIW